MKISSPPMKDFLRRWRSNVIFIDVGLPTDEDQMLSPPTSGYLRRRRSNSIFVDKEASSLVKTIMHFLQTKDHPLSMKARPLISSMKRSLCRWKSENSFSANEGLSLLTEMKTLCQQRLFSLVKSKEDLGRQR